MTMAILSAREEADLTWALHWAEGDIGLRSNFGAMVACLELGVENLGGVLGYGISESRLRAARRYRIVRRRLEQLAPRYQAILVSVYGERLWTLARLGRYSLVALLTPIVTDTSPAWLLQTHWNAEHGDTLSQLRISDVRKQARLIVDEARCAYALTSTRHRMGVHD